MKHKISIGVLVFKDNKLLLVKHVHPETGFTWWVPPGGGVKGSESITDAAKREVFEECGLKVEVGRPVLMRQLIYRAQDQNVLTIYFLTNEVSGEITTKNIQGLGSVDEQYIKEIRLFSKDEIKDIKVFPEYLQEDAFWDDVENNFPRFRFLGTVFDEG